MNKDNGYIKLFRKMQENFLWKESREFSKAEAWIDLLLEAQYRDKPTNIIVKLTNYIQNQGETFKTMKTWAKRWGWSRSRVRRFLTLLKNNQMIDYKTDHQTTKITINNFKGYGDGLPAKYP